MRDRRTWAKPLALAVLIALGSGLPLRAGADDQLELLARVEAIYDCSAEAPLPENPQGTIREAHRRLAELRPEIRERLEVLLSPPGGGSENGAPRAPGAENGEKVVEGEHACVFYFDRGANAVPPADGDGNGIPDYVDHVVQGVDKAWKTYERWGFRSPPMKALTVHFRPINCNAICHPEPGKNTWLEINSDIVGFNKKRLGASYSDDFTGDPDGPVAGMLRVTTAHELFHSFQMMYDWTEADWWCEGTADWAGKAVHPVSKFYLRNLGVRFRSPETSLFSNEGMSEYAASLFVLFLQENYGGGDEGARLIRKIWEGCADATAEEAAQSVLAELGTSLAESYTLFCCYNYLKEYGDAIHLPDTKVQTFASLPGKLSGPRLQRFGAAFLECRSTEDRGTLRFTGLLANAGFQLRLVTVDAGRNWRILPMSPQADGRYVAEVPGFGSRNVKATVVVTWTGGSESSPIYAVKAETR